MVVGSVRVSTEDQAEKGASLPAQRAKIRAYCASHGHELVDLLEDGGESARSLDRPGLRACLTMLDRGEASGLVVANVDRLTRHVGDLVFLVQKYFLAPGGNVLLSCSEPVETRTAVGRLHLYILAVVSQYTRESGAERTAGVMSHKRLAGQRLGNLPFGMSVAEDGETLIPCPADQAVEALIRELRAGGLTLRAIAKELDRRGIPGKRGVTRRSTGRWSHSSVGEILKRRDGKEDG